MNILNWFKRGGNTPPEVTEPATEPEPIGDLAKNIVKLFDEDKFERDDIPPTTGPEIYSLYQSRIYIIKGTEYRLVFEHYEKGIWNIKMGVYVFNVTEREYIASAVNRFNERRRIAEDKENNERIDALSREIARIANQTTESNQNAD